MPEDGHSLYKMLHIYISVIDYYQYKNRTKCQICLKYLINELPMSTFLKRCNWTLIFYWFHRKWWYFKIFLGLKGEHHSKVTRNRMKGDLKLNYSSFLDFNPPPLLIWNSHLVQNLVLLGKWMKFGRTGSSLETVKNYLLISRTTKQPVSWDRCLFVHQKCTFWYLVSKDFNNYSVIKHLWRLWRCKTVLHLQSPQRWIISE